MAVEFDLATQYLFAARSFEDAADRLDADPTLAPSAYLRAFATTLRRAAVREVEDAMGGDS